VAREGPVAAGSRVTEKGTEGLPPGFAGAGRNRLEWPRRANSGSLGARSYPSRAPKRTGANSRTLKLPDVHNASTLDQKVGALSPRRSLEGRSRLPFRSGTCVGVSSRNALATSACARRSRGPEQARFALQDSRRWAGEPPLSELAVATSLQSRDQQRIGLSVHPRWG
jgi:hypothetical protein